MNNAPVTTRITVMSTRRYRELVESMSEPEEESQVVYCAGCKQQRLCQEYEGRWFCLSRCWKGRKRHAAVSARGEEG